MLNIKKIFRSYWIIIHVVLTPIIATIVFFSVIVFLIPWAALVFFENYNIANMVLNNIYYIMTFSILIQIFLEMYLIYKYYVYKIQVFDHVFSWKSWSKINILSIVWVMMIVSISLNYFVKDYLQVPHQQSENILSLIRAWYLPFWLFAFIAIFTQPIFEEIIFRVMLFKKILEKNSFIVSSVIASAVFTIVHFAFLPGDMFIIFVLWFLLTAVFYKTQSIIPWIIFHVINNAIWVYFIYISL